MAEEEGPHVENLELDILGGARGFGEPGVDVFICRVQAMSQGCFDEEAVGGGAREGGREVGLRLENDLERGGRRRRD